MSEKTNLAARQLEPDKNPAHEKGAEHGKIDSPQRTENNMRETDLPRGSEKEVGAKSRRR